MMMDMTLQGLMPALPELFLVASGLVLLVAGVLRGNASTRPVSWAVVWSFLIAAVFMLGISWDKATLFNGMFVMDEFGGFMKLLILAGLAASVALSVKYLYLENVARFEFPILILFAGVGMMVMVSANNLLAMYVGLELQSLALYVLAAFKRDEAKSAEAGMKYFVLGALASGMLLFGASLVYGFTGTLDFNGIAQALDGIVRPDMGLIIGLAFVMAGLAFKISAVPFHMWTPDVYEGAPTAVTALFAMVPKIAAMALLMRLVFGPFGSIVDQWQQIVWFIAVGSMILGAFAGLVQGNVKRLLAYSSIGNMGYALMGVVAADAVGAGAVMLYLTLYMAMTAGVFGIVITMRRGGTAVERIDDLAGLSRTQPVKAYAMALLLLSMAGIPPLAGFFGKLMVFNAVVANGFYVLAVIGVLTSVVAAFYYLRMIKVMFFDEAAEPFDKHESFATRVVIIVGVLVAVLFVLAPDALVQSTRDAAQALF